MNEFLSSAKVVHEKIAKILLKDWDPIGIQNIAEAYDEYDSYVPIIYKLLISKKDSDEIFEYLWWIETEQMGLCGNRELTKNIAKKLQEIVE